jgi:hypothetical protein
MFVGNVIVMLLPFTKKRTQNRTEEGHRNNNDRAGVDESSIPPFYKEATEKFLEKLTPSLRRQVERLVENSKGAVEVVLETRIISRQERRLTCRGNNTDFNGQQSFYARNEYFN